MEYPSVRQDPRGLRATNKDLHIDFHPSAVHHTMASAPRFIDPVQYYVRLSFLNLCVRGKFSEGDTLSFRSVLV